MSTSPPLPDDVKASILKHLSDLERLHQVKVLLACEVGSRAWGLESPTSDYDVKFIYVRRINWYLGLEEVKRDLIDDDSAFDMNGWDLRKALQLLRESNCGILEWLHSPLRYKGEQAFLDELFKLAADAHCRRSLLLAYWSKAGKHYREYILVLNADGLISLKKYLFVLQALLSARWILAFSPDGADLPPQNFGTLLDSFTGTPHSLSKETHDVAHELMVGKRSGTLKHGEPITHLDTWITNELTCLEAACKKVPRKRNLKDTESLQPFSDLFTKYVIETSGLVQSSHASYFDSITQDE